MLTQLLPTSVISKKAILFDVDKTLTNSGADITPRTHQALQLAIGRGFLVATCTGRGYASLTKELMYSLPPKSLHIFCAGGVLQTADGVVAASSPIPQLAAQHILNLAQKVECIVYAKDSFLHYVFPEKGEHVNRYMQKVKVPIKALDQHAVETANIVYMSLYNFPSDQASDIQFEDTLTVKPVTSSLTGRIYYEITKKDVDKGTGVLQWAKLQGVNPHDIIGVGDSENDFALFREVGYKVAMGNAKPALKSEADLVIGGCDEDGLAVFIEQLCSER